MFLNSLQSEIKQFLKDNQIRLIKQFLELVSKNCLNATSWKNLKNATRAKSKTEFIQLLKKEFDSFEIEYKKTTKDKNSKDRVQKYRLKQSEKGLKSISCYLNVKTYAKLKKLSTSQNKTYSEIISNLVNSTK